MAISMSNEALTKVVAQSNKVVDNFLDGDYSQENIVKIADSATILNEYFNTLVNVVATQWTYDLLRGDTSFYSVFERPSEQYGDAIEMIVPKGQNVITYSEITSPFDNSIPKTEFETAYLITNERWKVPLRYSVEIIRGALLKPYGLRDILGIIVKNMYDFLNIKKYEVFTDDIINSINKTYTVQPITTEGEVSKARALYEAIKYVANEFTLPSTEWNESGLKTNTPRGSMVLIWNSRVKASIDVNVVESLFNANELTFRDKITVDFGDGNENLMCILMDEEAYVNVPRFEAQFTNINSATAEQITFLHYWTRHGSIPWRNAVKFISE